MKSHSNSKIPSDEVQDVAMAVTTNSHSHKGSKGSAVSKDDNISAEAHRWKAREKNAHRR